MRLTAFVILPILLLAALELPLRGLMSVPATISELQENGLSSLEEIMGKMADMYASLSSYQDTGTVETRNSGSAITKKSLFRTTAVQISGKLGQSVLIPIEIDLP